MAFLGILLTLSACSRESSQRWSAEKANEWYGRYAWFAGTNFTPSTAINQLEMWQAATFDPATIDRELKWSAELGFNLHRVFLHNLPWEQDSAGFLDRIDQFLDLADQHGIKIMFVLLDDVWDPEPAPGPQRAPVQGLHNSGWVQAPGRAYLVDETRHPLIEAYVKGILTRFKDDDRVAIWDLYNEPANANVGSYGAESDAQTELSPAEKEQYSLRLVSKVFDWAREVNPSQPLTMGVWRGDFSQWGTPGALPAVDSIMLLRSDIITFHTYEGDLGAVKTKIEQLRRYGRPLICTEYMARTNNNLFADVMPLFKEANVGAINWGFVSGKTNTIYPWQTWEGPFSEEPTVWFHDILRPDGTPFSQEEVDLIKRLTGA
ncbi:MAG: cellulase family glycosylhydrolase [Lewinella sp.]|nr:cellulase family glycosylhydrolase [Lewinella sp.]